MSGIYAVWRFIERHGRQCYKAPAIRTMAVVGGGWGLGFLLAAPFLMPVLEYSRTGNWYVAASGAEERPPVGWEALPQTVLPDIYGSTNRFVEGNQLESSASLRRPFGDTPRGPTGVVQPETPVR